MPPLGLTPISTQEDGGNFRRTSGQASGVPGRPSCPGPGRPALRWLVVAVHPGYRKRLAVAWAGCDLSQAQPPAPAKGAAPPTRLNISPTLGGRPAAGPSRPPVGGAP